MNPNNDLAKHIEPGSENIRVLHIGNIANNGYNIANLFNQAGIKSDLIIGPYYHVAGCPEWEDAEFDGELGDQFHPAWNNVKITNGFKRPIWAAQGPWVMCIKYLLHKNKNNTLRAKYYWSLLKFSQIHPNNNKVQFLTASGLLLKIRLHAYNKIGEIRLHAYNKIWKIKNLTYLSFYYSRKFIFQIIKSLLISNRFTKKIFYKLKNYRNSKIKINAEINSNSVDSAQINTTNTETPINDELIQYRNLAHLMKPLFDYYDVIVGYSTDGIWSLLEGKKYIAYEHGTIRTIPFQDDAQGRLCKLVYQNADSVIISNFDNNKAAERMRLSNYTCIPHYINEMYIPKELGESLRKKLVDQFDTDFILYNPSRQHWSDQKDLGWEKGNDILIKGFADFIKNTNPKALGVFTEWGESINESKQLISDLGIDDRVIWVQPVPHKQMIEYIQASHVVSDQFLLGTFGGIPAKAFMHSRPVLSSFDSEIHEWCFDEMPPFLESHSSECVLNSLNKIFTDKNFYNEISEASKFWYYNHHSNEKLLNKFSKELVQVLQK